MSESQLTVTYSIEEILKQINQKLDNLQKDVTDLKIGQTKMEAELKGDMARIEAKLDGKITALDEKVNGLSKRLENQEFVNRGILVALVVAIIGGAAKLFGWVGKP